MAKMKPEADKKILPPFLRKGGDLSKKKGGAKMQAEALRKMSKESC